MKLLKNIGLIIFLLGLVTFTLLPFVGGVKLSNTQFKENVSEHEFLSLNEPFQTEIIDVSFSNSTSFGLAVMNIYNDVNNQYRANEAWDKVMHQAPKEFTLNLAKVASYGPVKDHPTFFFFITFGLCILGGLIFIYGQHKLQPHAGIKNDGIYHSSTTNRGWIGIIAAFWLIGFYVFLYSYPFAIVNQIYAVQPVKNLFVNDPASQWFLYGFIYTMSMMIMGVKMILKYRHNRYQIVRTVTVVLFQVIFAFLLVEILPLFDLPGKDLKNAWPLDYTFLFEWNVKGLIESGHFGKFVFVWGCILSIIVVPIMVYFYGKRWYCSWVCGCGGLAETVGDSYRHLSNKKLWSWKLERWLIHAVLVFAILMTVFTGYHTYNEIYSPAEMENKHVLFGFSAYNIREIYGFLIGTIFAGVIGTGFYPILGNRSWCRFGCPLAAYMGIVQRFKSRFRITTNGGQCISCGNCSTYCEQGIDVRAYAQKGQNIVRASCVGCGVCSAVCPRGVLKLENADEKGRFGNEGPIVLGNDGFRIDV